MKRILLLMAVNGIMMGAAHAAQWGMAGCGFGSVVVNNKGRGAQVFAATLNTVSLQTLAIASGTSNCESGSIQEEASLFIIVNQQALKRDIARGDGESLRSLGAILRCSGQGSELLGDTLRRDFGRASAGWDATGDELVRAIDSSIQKNILLRNACAIYG